jgi:antitoxin HicB
MKIDKTLIQAYPFTIRPLTGDDGGGFAIEYPDLPGCISDGNTPEDALKHGAHAVKAYLRSCVKHGDPIPQPSTASGQWRQRVPRSLHARLVVRARQEGVSLNTLVTALIAEGLGARKASNAVER